ncbi:MAG: hypothetical protein M5U14_00790 [Acidimicrobiia bacterium]|nr:hypothetical protein [Acidimicrobiia bacterium]
MTVTGSTTAAATATWVQATARSPPVWAATISAGASRASQRAYTRNSVRERPWATSTSTRMRCTTRSPPRSARIRSTGTAGTHFSPYTKRTAGSASTMSISINGRMAATSRAKARRRPRDRRSRSATSRAKLARLTRWTVAPTVLTGRLETLKASW